MPKPNQSFFVFRILSKYFFFFFFFLQKQVFKENGEWRIEPKMRRFLTVFASAIKKDPYDVNKKTR